MIKQILLLLCLLFALSGRVGFCSEAMYQITATELTQLDQIFSELQTNNEQLMSDLTASKADLTAQQELLAKYRQDLEKLQAQLIALKIESTQAKAESKTVQDLLTKANESLATYAQEVKRTHDRLEHQRNTWAIVALVAAVV